MAYDNPAGLIAMAVILEILAIAAVAARFVSRGKLEAGFKADDWLVVAALVFGTGLCVMEIYGCAVNALGTPLDATIEDPRATDGRLNKTKHIELSFLLLGITALAFIKLSAVFLYRRIFGTKGWFGMVTLVWIILITVWGAGFVIAGLSECGSHLRSLFGTPQAYLDHCGSAIPSGWGMVLSDLITDFITLLIPLPMIVKLHTSARRKFAIAGVFAIGLFTVAASCTKAAVYIRATLGLYQEDAIIILTTISVWNYIEVMVGILAACAITFRPLLHSVGSSSTVSSLLRTLRMSSVGSSMGAKTDKDTDSDYSGSTRREEADPKTNAADKNAIAVERTYAVYLDDGRVEANQSDW